LAVLVYSILKNK